MGHRCRRPLTTGQMCQKGRVVPQTFGFASMQFAAVTERMSTAHSGKSSLWHATALHAHAGVEGTDCHSKACLRHRPISSCKPQLYELPQEPDLIAHSRLGLHCRHATDQGVQLCMQDWTSHMAEMQQVKEGMVHTMSTGARKEPKFYAVKGRACKIETRMRQAPTLGSSSNWAVSTCCTSSGTFNQCKDLRQARTSQLLQLLLHRCATAPPTLPLLANRYCCRPVATATVCQHYSQLHELHAACAAPWQGVSVCPSAPC